MPKHKSGHVACEHKTRRIRCAICGGSQICEHNRLKERCKECGGSAICEHNMRKERCKDCNGSAICEHNKRRERCRDCGGSGICAHDKLKERCKQCGGRDLCKSPWCEKRRIEKYDNYCLTCVIQLRPDIQVSRNYKTKETSVIHYIGSQFPDFDWVGDKKIKDGCSSRRPDYMCDFGSHIVINEIDENKHTDYDTSCEHKRMMQISKDLGHRPIIFIRFNPDSYVNKEGKRTPSCWKLGKDGILRVPDKQKNNWNNRLEKLKETIDFWTKNPSEKTIEIVHLFYDENECITT